MVKDVKYTFRVIVSDEGNQSPSFAIWPSAIGKYLNCLSGKTNIHSINQIIADVESVCSGEKSEAWVTDGGDCEFKITEETTQLENYYEDFESVKFSTNSFLMLFKDWLKFIEKYNNCGIPGIIPNGKKEELVIVPRSAVKESYWKEDQDKV